ncbi:50S ribosomal protein L29 [Patescibacteria group bacterium]|nr:MAG: 50S ribosomal protein L29 [Patescibacteria group bacterium]
MDTKELQALTAAERARELAHARERLRRLRFEANQGKLTKVREIRVVRTLIARLETMAAKERAAR